MHNPYEALLGPGTRARSTSNLTYSLKRRGRALGAAIAERDLYIPVATRRRSEGLYTSFHIRWETQVTTGRAALEIPIICLSSVSTSYNPFARVNDRRKRKSLNCRYNNAGPITVDCADFHAPWAIRTWFSFAYSLGVSSSDRLGGGKPRVFSAFVPHLSPPSPHYSGFPHQTLGHPWNRQAIGNDVSCLHFFV